jgi:hypothetical protein
VAVSHPPASAANSSREAERVTISACSQPI